MEYKSLSDGEWTELDNEDHKIACCDCGLIHKLEGKVTDNKVSIRFFRENRSTGQYRRHNKIKVRRIDSTKNIK